MKIFPLWITKSFVTVFCILASTWVCLQPCVCSRASFQKPNWSPSSFSEKYNFVAPTAKRETCLRFSTLLPTTGTASAKLCMRKIKHGRGNKSVFFTSEAPKLSFVRINYLQKPLSVSFFSPRISKSGLNIRISVYLYTGVWVMRFPWVHGKTLYPPLWSKQGLGSKLDPQVHLNAATLVAFVSAPTEAWARRHHVVVVPAFIYSKAALFKWMGMCCHWTAKSRLEDFACEKRFSGWLFSIFQILM